MAVADDQTERGVSLRGLIDPVAVHVEPVRQDDDTSLRGFRFSPSLMQDPQPAADLPRVAPAPTEGLSVLLRREPDRSYGDVSRFLAARDAALPYAPERQDLALDWRLGLVAPAAESGLGLDLGFTPRATFGRGEETQTRSAGAQLSLGNFIDVGEGTPRSWYVFAAADGKQVTWDMDERDRASFAPDMKLGERVVVGDLQAGVSIARFGGQFGLSYMQREVSSEDVQRTEQFAAFSFSLKR